MIVWSVWFLVGVVAALQGDPPFLVFKEYPYVKTAQSEKIFNEFEAACEQSPSCSYLTPDGLGGVDRVNCVRECMSPSCFIELYQANRLEPGEIDVRLNSFKGCFTQRRYRH